PIPPVNLASQFSLSFFLDPLFFSPRSIRCSTAAPPPPSPPPPPPSTPPPSHPVLKPPQRSMVRDARHRRRGGEAACEQRERGRRSRADSAAGDGAPATALPLLHLATGHWVRARQIGEEIEWMRMKAHAHGEKEGRDSGLTTPLRRMRQQRRR
ncbi:unnamed protein product, partial [Urochloa humidicola]